LKLKTILMMALVSSSTFGVNAQGFIWPTDASKYLTSSFAEYRAGHFHAGIDIKTWGTVGYKVFAIADGYILRVLVSPFGYGKVIYHRLNSGETVIYAHLNGFNDAIEQIVKNEQRKVGEYRIDQYFRTNELPVKQGDLIAFSGATGIGEPHLHFEIRDKSNRPTNPFLYGYKVEDTIPPFISAVSVTPLNADARVNSDVVPFIVKPRRTNLGTYQIDDQFLVHGDIGFAIDCFDQANGVSNSFAVYQLKFYIDDKLIFGAVYNQFSYEQTHLIVFERDYRLLRRDLGIFQKLYKEPENELTFYSLDCDNLGIIHCEALADANDADEALRYTFGLHQFRIEAVDFNGNLSTVQGEFFVGKRKRIFLDLAATAERQFFIKDIYDEDGNTIRQPRIQYSSNEGRSWKDYDIVPDVALDLFRKTNEPNASPVRILKIMSAEHVHPPAFPLYKALLRDSLAANSPIDCRITKDFYDDYLRLELWVSGFLQELPRLFVQQMGNLPVELELTQNTIDSYVGIYKLIPGKDGPAKIEVRARDLLNKELLFWDQFDIRTITPEQGGAIVSRDSNCTVKFGTYVVYRNLFLRINEAEGLDSSKNETVGCAYQIEPQDVPLKRSALVSLTYPANDSLPGKLGVYGCIKKNRWNFVGNKLNSENRTISANLSSLRYVTLIRDTAPPEIIILAPSASTQQKHPTLKASVIDRLSGIASERAIVMKLDDRKVIAEYDPERHAISYEVEEGLAVGRHTMSVWAIDNSKNEKLVSFGFHVIE